MIVPPKVATWIKLNSRALGDRRVEGTREGSIVIIIHKEKEPKEADLGRGIVISRLAGRALTLQAMLI